MLFLILEILRIILDKVTKKQISCLNYQKKQEARSLLKSINNKKYGLAEDSNQDNDMMVELEDIPEEVPAAPQSENNDTVESTDLEITQPAVDIVEESQSGDGNLDFQDMDVSMD